MTLVVKLREAVLLDKEGGKLTWCVRPLHHFNGNTHAMNAWNTRFAGKQVGSQVCMWGRWAVQSTFCGKTYGLHAMIWALAYGYFPQQIDHIDGNALNNRLENLREVTMAENNRNRRFCPRKSGLPMGIRRQKKGFRVYMKIAGATTGIGTYASLEEAVAERDAAYIRNGYHPNHGKLRDDSASWV